jgi:hypothetical protein
MPGCVGRLAHATRPWWRFLPPAAKPRHSNPPAFGISRLWWAGLLCSAWLNSAATYAGELGYATGSYLSYESNIDRVETNTRPELIASVFGGLSYKENTADVTGRVYAYVERRHFTQHTFSDDTRGYVQGSGAWTLLPKRLVWIADDTFQDVQVSVTAPNSPGNLTESNSFNTGPDLTIPLSPANAFVTGGRYGRFDIKDSNADNHRYLLYARALHTMPSLSKLSLNYEKSRVYFEPGTAFSQAVRDDVFVHYETAAAGEGLYAGDGARIDLGKSRVTQYPFDSTASSNTLDGHIVRVLLSKGVTKQFAVRASYSDQISDTYSDLIAGIAGSSGSLAPTEGSVFIVQGTGFATADIYHSKRADVGFTSHGGDIEYTLQPYARTVDFQTLDQDDYREVGGLFFWRWLYSGATRFDVFATASTRNYGNIDRTDRDRNYGASTEFKVNRNLTLSLLAGQAQRQSTAPGQSYVDRRAILFFGYSANYELRFMR